MSRTRDASTVAPKVAPTGAGTRADAWVIPLALAVCAFAAHAWVAFALDRMGVFNDADVLFQADCNFRLTTIAHATGASHDIRHPNLGVFVSPFVRLLTLPVRLIAHPHGVDALNALREEVALVVSPIAGAVRTATLYRIARRLGAAAWAAALVALVDLLAFGSLLLGSVPETFPITAACTAVLCWFVLDAPADDRTPARRRTAWWIAVGAFATGVTLTNVVTVGVLAACAALRRLGPDWRAWSVRRALAPARWLGLVLAGSVAVNALGLVVTRAVLHVPIATSVPPDQRYLHGDPARAAAELAVAFGNTFIAPRPTVGPNLTQRPGPQPHTQRFSSVVPHSLTYPYPTPAAESTGEAWRVALVWCVLAAGTAALAAARRDWASRVLLFGVLALLAWNVALHLVFGHEFLLYSQHWAPLMAVLLTGLVVARGRWRAPAAVVLIAFAAIVAVDAPRRVGDVLTTLRTAQ